MKETRTASNRRGRPPASEADLQHARQVIMQAALKVYGETGYERSTVEMILAEAGISRPTFYKSFANKQEVMTACVEQAIAQLYESVSHQVTTDKAPLEQVGAAVRAYLEWGAALGPVTARFYSEMAHPDSPFGIHRQRLIQRLMMLFQMQIRAMGRTQPDPLLLETLITVVEFVGSRHFTEGNHSVEDLERRYRVVMRVLLAAIAEPAELANLPSIPQWRS